MKVIYLLLLISLMLWACSPLPQPEPQQETRAVQPQLFAHETDEGVQMNWGWFVWEEGEEIGTGRVVPQRFAILVSEGERGNWEEIASVSGLETTYLVPDVISGQPYFLAVQAQADDASPSRSNVVMVVPGGAAVVSQLVPEDGKARKWATWGVNDQWITYTREVEGQLQLYRYQLETRSETFLRNGYAPSSAREKNQMVFLLAGESMDGTEGNGPSLVSTSENGIKMLVEGKGAIVNPSLSPSGDEVIFLAGQDETSWGLWHLNLAENEQRYLLGTTDLAIPSISEVDKTAQHPNWSPDGESIVYDRLTDKGGWVVKDLYQIPAAGGVEEVLLRSEWNDFSPAIHPTGNELAFVSDRSGRLAIWSYQKDRGALRQWTGDVEVRIDPETGLTWNQAGTQLLFTALTEDGAQRLMLATP
ncbi:MAG: hypothetical protein AAF399_08200 [Bacteroidota bacterium]